MEKKTSEFEHRKENPTLKEKNSEYEKWKSDRGITGNGISAVRKMSTGRKILIAALVVIILLAAVYCIGKSMSEYIHTKDYGNYIAVLDIEGEITDSAASSPFGDAAQYDQDFLLETVGELIDDSGNKGIFLRVNTPGGSAYASDEFYLKIKEYQEKTGKPVYAYFGSMAASGGYYISASADKIYANRNCWTGSIGVTVGTFFDFSGLLERYGIKTQTINSGRNKAMGSTWQEMTAEQKEIFQSLIDEAYEQFVGIVADGRGMSVAEVKKIADGRIYTAVQAKKNGLIDGIMSEEEAMDAMKKENKLSGSEFRPFEPPEDDTSFLGLLTKAADRRNEFDELGKIVEAVRTGNVFMISYKANINK